MYSRFPNHAAQTLAAFNDRGRFMVADENDAVAKNLQNVDLFLVARLLIPVNSVDSLSLLLVEYSSGQLQDTQRVICRNLREREQE